MDIIIIGAGDVGFMLAKVLSYERHNIVLIENNPEKCARANDALDIQVFQGSGTSFPLLEKAGIKQADMLVAVTDSDEVNLLAAIMAKDYGVAKTIARVRNRDFLREDSPLSAKKLDIDLLIHPESMAAHGAITLLKQSAASDIIEFAQGRIVLMGIQLDSNAPILYRPLIQLAKDFDPLPFRTIAIQRKDITKIPVGTDMFLPNDRIFVVVPKEHTADLIRETGKENVKIEDIMILGGGQTGYMIAKELEDHYNIKVIESNADKSTGLAERLRKALVIKGDGRDINLLAVEGIIDMHAFIAVTGDDETNIISCLMAKHLEVPKIISLINKTDYTPIIPTIGINAFISKQQLTVNGILKFIRRGAVLSVASIPGIAAEAIELAAQKNSKITKKKIADLKFPKGAILGAVMRGDDVFIPIGDSQLQADDKVVLFAIPSAIREVEKFFY